MSQIYFEKIDKQSLSIVIWPEEKLKQVTDHIMVDQYGSEFIQTKLLISFIRCDVDLLLATLCSRSIQTREGSIVKALDCNAAVAGRDALAKTVYARLFDW